MKIATATRAVVKCLNRRIVASLHKEINRILSFIVNFMTVTFWGEIRFFKWSDNKIAIFDIYPSILQRVGLSKLKDYVFNYF